MCTQEELTEWLPAIANTHLFAGDELGHILMSLSVLSASMPTRDHMITNRLPSAVKVPVLPQRHHMRDHDVFYGILLSPDVIGVNCLDVVALKVQQSIAIQKSAEIHQIKSSDK